MVATPWLHCWPSLFAGLGCPTIFDHRLLVIQPLRWLHLTLRDDVKAELHKLLDAGIIEWVDASLCVSNLVMTKKSTGGL